MDNDFFPHRAAVFILQEMHFVEHHYTESVQRF